MSINADMQNMAKQCPCAWELRRCVLFWRAAMWRYTFLISFHSACFEVCFFVFFGQIFELEGIDLSIHLYLINLGFSIKCNTDGMLQNGSQDGPTPKRCLASLKRCNSFNRLLAKELTRSCLVLFMRREICESKLWGHGNSVIKNWTGR